MPRRRKRSSPDEKKETSMEPSIETYPLVYRFNEPKGRKGKLCRQVKLAPIVRKQDGRIIANAGTERVPLLFEDGVELTASRSAVVLASSRPGRQAIARAARGDVERRRGKR